MNEDTIADSAYFFMLKSMRKNMSVGHGLSNVNSVLNQQLKIQKCIFWQKEKRLRINTFNVISINLQFKRYSQTNLLLKICKTFLNTFN